MVLAVAGVHRVMVELATATDKAGKAIAEGKTQLQKTVEKVHGQNKIPRLVVLESLSGVGGGGRGMIERCLDKHHTHQSSPHQGKVGIRRAMVRHRKKTGERYPQPGDL